jgi:hypothetical protein
MSFERCDPEPEHDRLNGIMTAALEAAKEHPDWQEGDQLILVAGGARDETSRCGAIICEGYDDASDVIYELVRLAEAMSKEPGVSVSVRLMGVSPN